MWKLRGSNSNSSVGVNSTYGAQPYLPLVINYHVTSSVLLFLHKWTSSEGPQECIQRKQSIPGLQCTYSCSILNLRVLECFKNTCSSKMIVEKLLAPKVWNCAIFALWRECASCPGRTCQWWERMLKVCHFAEYLLRFFSVSVQQLWSLIAPEHEESS